MLVIIFRLFKVRQRRRRRRLKTMTFQIFKDLLMIISIKSMDNMTCQSLTIEGQFNQRLDNMTAATGLQSSTFEWSLPRISYICSFVHLEVFHPWGIWIYIYIYIHANSQYIYIYIFFSNLIPLPFVQWGQWKSCITLLLQAEWVISNSSLEGCLAQSSGTPAFQVLSVGNLCIHTWTCFLSMCFNQTYSM